MVKPKKPEIGVWKTVESKGRKHQREKPKFNVKLSAKSQRQKNVNDASRSKNSNRQKSSPREKCHNWNRQWSNSHTSMSFPSHGSPKPMPSEAYFNMHYFCPPWYYNSYMPSLPRYFCPDYITYREPVINEPSPMRNDRFDHKNQSAQKNKHKVIKQVYHVKKDGRLNKNSDLTLDIEKLNIESSASSTDQIVPNDKHISKNIAEHQSSSAGGQAAGSE